jgi:hypothetical protein
MPDSAQVHGRITPKNATSAVPPFTGRGSLSISPFKGREKVLRRVARRKGRRKMPGPLEGKEKRALFLLRHDEHIHAIALPDPCSLASDP